MNMRDKNGYPLEGIDMVPIHPKKPNNMAELMKLLQEANRCEEKERENADYWRRAYFRGTHSQATRTTQTLDPSILQQ